MGSVAEDNDRRPVVVGFALDADEGKVGVLLEGRDEFFRGDKLRHAGKVFVEEGDEESGWVGLQLGVNPRRSEEGADEGTALRLLAV